MQNRNSQRQQGSGFTQGFNEGFSGRGQQPQSHQERQSYGGSNGRDYQMHPESDYRSDRMGSNAYEADRFDHNEYQADRLTNGFNTHTNRFDFARDGQRQRNQQHQQWDPSFHPQGYSSYNDEMSRTENWGQGRPSSSLQGGYQGTTQGQTGWSQPGYTSSQGLSSSSSVYNGTRHETQWDAKHSGKGPKGYKRSDDKIKEDVCEALEHHAGIDATEIEVAMKEGIATLSGTIESRQMKRLAEECVEGIRGVQDVKNELRVDTTIASSGRTHSLSDSDTTDSSSRNSTLNGKNQAGRTSTSVASSTSATKQ